MKLGAHYAERLSVSFCNSKEIWQTKRGGINVWQHCQLIEREENMRIGHFIDGAKEWGDRGRNSINVWS